MRTLYLTIGVIGSGKSTWSREAVEDDKNTIIISRDSLREMVYGKYLFIPKMEFLIKEMVLKNIDVAFKNGFDVIVDETNLTMKKRKKLIKNIRKNTDIEFVYYYIYFPYQTGGVDRRMKDNSRGYTKEKWQEVFDGMIKRIEYPSKEEMANDKNCVGLKIISFD